MAEYIKRDAALSAQNKSMNLNEMRERLKRIPAADVVERKHGEWIHRTGNRDECSNCGARYYQDFKEPFMNFCPNCGADMRGEDDGT